MPMRIEESLVELLGPAPTGPIAVAACQALSRISGQPRELHFEYWLAWWAERTATMDAGADSNDPSPR